MNSIRGMIAEVRQKEEWDSKQYWNATPAHDNKNRRGLQ